MNRRTTKTLGAIAGVIAVMLTVFGFFGDFMLLLISKLIGKNVLNSDLTFLFVPISCIGILLLFVLTLIVNFRTKSQRRDTLQALARQMGWTYTEQTNLPFLKEFDKYLNDSWAGGANVLTGSSNNVLIGKMQDRNALVADQIFSTGSQKHRTTHEVTILGIEVSEAQFPIMSVSPEGLMDKLLDGFAKYDIDFPHRPLFSQKYVLYGKNENDIRGFFSDDILAFYEQQSPFTTVCGGKYLVIYDSGVLLKSHEIMARLNFLVNLAHLFYKKRS